MAESLTLHVSDQHRVPAVWMRPDAARAVLVLGPGAGSRLDSPLLVALAQAWLQQGLATLRFHYPYHEAGRRRPDPTALLLATVREANATAARLAPELPRFLGGHSMSGRLATLVMAEGDADPGVRGVVCLAFPLAGKSAQRVPPLARVAVPLLFVQGDRDALTDLDEIAAVANGLGERAQLVSIPTADHGLRGRARTTPELWQQVAAAVTAWVRAQV